MKITALCILSLCIMGLVVSANAEDEEWCGVWGHTWKDAQYHSYYGVAVQCSSTAGHTCINYSYWKNMDTQYDFDGNGGSPEIVNGRYYYCVAAWKTSDSYVGQASGFTWTGGALLRDIILVLEDLDE